MKSTESNWLAGARAPDAVITRRAPPAARLCKGKRWSSLCSGDLGHLEELFLGIDSDSLRCSRFPNVCTGHLAISQEAFAEVLLGEGNHLPIAS